MAAVGSLARPGARVRGISVLLVVFGARLREEEELVQVPVALCRGRVAEGQPLLQHTSYAGGVNAALQAQAG